MVNWKQNERWTLYILKENENYAFAQMYAAAVVVVVVAVAYVRFVCVYLLYCVKCVK